MAELRDLDATDASNTTIGGIGSQGTNTISNFDNIVRAMAGMLKRMVTGAAPIDDTFTLADPADLTKRMRIDAGLVTAGQTRVLTMSDANLTLATMAGQAAGAVAITGGTITGITDLAVADGGTGASTAANARTNLGVAIGSDVQAYDATLAALAGLSAAAGFVAQTGTDTFTKRTLTGTANEITVTNGAGDTGVPTLSLPTTLTFTGKTVMGGSFTGGAIDNTGIGVTTAAAGKFTDLTATGTTQVGGATFNAGSDVTPSGSNGQLRIAGNGYGAYIANDATATYLGNNSPVRSLYLQTDATTRAAITSAALHVGKTAGAIGTVGVSLYNSGASTGLLQATRDGDIVAQFNRLTSDGTIVEFMQAGTAEGSVSVSGTTVTYNTFCGAHWGQLGDGAKPEILRGTICDSIDAMNEWFGDDGKPLANDQLPRFKVSDEAGSSSVYGVFMTWDNDDDKTNDATIAALGAYLIRVNKDVKVKRGDLIESNGDGTGRVQEDDLFRSRTVAKVTSPTVIETFADGSYLVPCTLHCG